MVPAQAPGQKTQTLSGGVRTGGKSVDTILMVTKDFLKKKNTTFFKKRHTPFFDSVFLLEGRCANRLQARLCVFFVIGMLTCPGGFFGGIDLRWRFQ